MSGAIIPNQTNTNKDSYFFALAGAGGGGVQTITAGSNITSVTGTSNVTINALGTVAAITAGSNVTVSGTSNVTINAIGTVAEIIAGSNITVSGTSNVTINATGGTQGVVTYNNTLTAAGSNEVAMTSGLASDCFGINTNAYNIPGDAYLMTATAKITNATFVGGAPNGYIQLCCSVGSVVGSSPFIFFPFPKVTTDITGSNAADYIINVSGVFVSDLPSNPVSVGVDNQSGANIGAGAITISLTNISFVGLGNDINVQTNWL